MAFYRWGWNILCRVLFVSNLSVFAGTDDVSRRSNWLRFLLQFLSSRLLSAALINSLMSIPFDWSSISLCSNFLI